VKFAGSEGTLSVKVSAKVLTTSPLTVRKAESLKNVLSITSLVRKLKSNVREEPVDAETSKLKAEPSVKLSKEKSAPKNSPTSNDEAGNPPSNKLSVVSNARFEP